jgi:uncharacterized protein (DUF983 family)
VPKISMVASDELPANSRAVMSAAPDSGSGRLFTGHGTLDLACGNCDQVIAQGLREADELAHLVLQCNGCLTYNRTDP